MKLRIRGNSIRLRLLRGEVEEFGKKGIVREMINFGASKLSYILQTAEDADELSAQFNGNKIIIRIPLSAAREWTETNLISLKGEQKISKDKVLKILIEKDFVCLDRPNDEDNNDAYPNTSHKC